MRPVRRRQERSKFALGLLQRSTQPFAPVQGPSPVAHNTNILADQRQCPYMRIFLRLSGHDERPHQGADNLHDLPPCSGPVVSGVQVQRRLIGDRQQDVRQGLDRQRG